ncbi:larval cuticle protein A3A-like [Musca vetustissima]|uniref:larval cuticle protein A3A-like n=1 Tax=Musca vetustissima TaxID=27455 RepID=UPI002AB6883E|nr:larval cuticle protein A3A-like [Musca vetustissima]
MAFKFIAILAFVAVANAGYISSPPSYKYEKHQPAYIYPTEAPVKHIVPVVQKVLTKHVEHYESSPQYKFSYNVDDNTTGDSKTQFEERNGDVVHGEYSLIDADGYKRIVTYTADAHNGFNAVVRREPLNKVVHSEPVAVKTHYVAPEHYSSPDHYITPSHYSTADHYTAKEIHYRPHSSPSSSSSYYHH